MYCINSFCVEIDREQIDQISQHIHTHKTNFLRLTFGPEHILPKGVKWKSLEHALYVTYTCLIDYSLRRVADDLWAASRKLFENHLREMYPKSLIKKRIQHFIPIFEKYYKNVYRAPATPEKMAHRVFNAAKYLFRTVNGDPRKIFRVYLNLGKTRDAEIFLNWLKDQKYKGLPDGDKVIKLWFRTMCEREQIELGNGMWNLKRHELAKIPLPIDKNIISAGIALGLVRVVKGSFEGSFSGVKQPFHDAWMSVANRSHVLPLQLDEPIWKIGRNCRRKKCGLDCFFGSLCPRITNFMFHGETSAPGPAWDILVWPRICVE